MYGMLVSSEEDPPQVDSAPSTSPTDSRCSSVSWLVVELFLLIFICIYHKAITFLTLLVNLSVSCINLNVCTSYTIDCLVNVLKPVLSRASSDVLAPCCSLKGPHSQIHVRTCSHRHVVMYSWSPASGFLSSVDWWHHTQSYWTKFRPYCRTKPSSSICNARWHHCLAVPHWW